MERLKGKVAFISGGARGLGAEMARLLHGAGAHVRVTDILEDEGHALAHDHENLTFMAHDVWQEDQWAAAIAATKNAYGGLDVLVNNAGIAHNATTIEETSYEQ
ncbi:MAG: SDR family NAD(P)-dependent oxidoreductase, partial [Pseudomonadota bacterium]|nr:SDR family NAD(P)-dependent oxidoreductase [Pseudomonadota bacterium]